MFGFNVGEFDARVVAIGFVQKLLGFCQRPSRLLAIQNAIEILFVTLTESVSLQIQFVYITVWQRMQYKLKRMNEYSWTREFYEPFDVVNFYWIRPCHTMRMCSICVHPTQKITLLLTNANYIIGHCERKQKTKQKKKKLNNIQYVCVIWRVSDQIGGENKSHSCYCHCLLIINVEHVLRHHGTTCDYLLYHYSVYGISPQTVEYFINGSR